MRKSIQVPDNVEVKLEDILRITNLEKTIRENLESIYEEVMWLAKRPNTTPGAARAWYTHVAAAPLRRHIRQFTGKVSKSAVNDATGNLHLEHFKRMQTTLTQLIERHLKEEIHNASEFVSIVLECEQVHIVTVSENSAARKADGNYIQAGIELVCWEDIPEETRLILWKKKLRRNVANHTKFAPKTSLTD